MIEAVGPSTRGVAGCTFHSVPAPPGVVMLAPQAIPRNASQGLKAKGRAKEGKSGKPGAAKGHYESRGPVGSGQSEGRAA
jgi:hypothetical protein